MSRGSPKILKTATPSGDREYALLKAMIAAWDDSKEPTDNSDRAKKLGSGDSTGMAAILEFESDTFASYVCDGYTRGKIVSRRPFNPDNFALRLVDPEGKGKRSQWDVRLSVDSRHKDFERENLSTMLIDQCDKQSWAFSRDIWKLIKLGAEIKHDELAFTDAGFLWQMRKKGAKNMTRGAWATNISQRGGFVSDGKRAGQFSHVFSLPGILSQPGPAEGTGKTIAGPPFSGSGKTKTEGCGEVEVAQSALRGDVNFDMAGRLVHLAIEQGGPTDGEILGGAHWIGGPAPLGPLKELDSEDSVSNQTKLIRATLEGLRTFVKKPRFPDMPTFHGDRAIPSGFPGVPATGTPITSTSGAYATQNYRAVGTAVGTVRTVPIPEDIASGWTTTVDVNFITPIGAGFTRGVTATCSFVVTGPGDSAAPGAATESQTTLLDATSHPGTQVLRSVRFRLDPAKIQNKHGGKIAIAFYRAADAGGDDLHVVGIGVFLGKTQLETTR